MLIFRSNKGNAKTDQENSDLNKKIKTMKNIITTLFCVFIYLSSSLSLAAQCTQDPNFYYAFLNEDNLETVLDSAAAFYSCHNPDSNDGLGTNVPSVDYAIDTLARNFLQSLLDLKNVSLAGCYSGYPKFSNILNNNDPSGISEMDVDWNSSSNSSIGYTASYLDFKTSHTDYFFKRRPSISLLVNGRLPKKMYAFNSVCDSEQSGYFIIIIEKDISLTEMPTSEGELPPGEAGPPELRLQQDKNDLNLEIFPNPANLSAVNISFELKQKDFVSLQIVQASTGRNVQQVMNHEFVQSGKIEKQVLLKGLNPDVYFVIFQTKTDRIVQKLVVM